MKKIIALIFTLYLIILLTGCNSLKPNTDGTAQNQTETNEPVIEQPNDSNSVETVNSNSKENSDTTEDTNDTVGAVDAGDELLSPYLGYVDGVVLLKGTFSENYYHYMDDFDEMEGKWEYNRPAVMYHLAREMKLTREDLEVYYTALGCVNVPENVYAGLLADTLEESMQLLKTEYAFYNNGKLYTIYDIYKLDNEKTLTFNIHDDVYDSVWKSIDAYLKTPTAVDVGDAMREYVSERTDANE